MKEGREEEEETYVTIHGFSHPLLSVLLCPNPQSVHTDDTCYTKTPVFSPEAPE